MLVLLARLDSEAVEGHKAYGCHKTQADFGHMDTLDQMVVCFLDLQAELDRMALMDRMAVCWFDLQCC